MRTLTDNTSLSSKVMLRRHVLEIANFKSVTVLDLCAGEGKIWKEMRKHVNISGYTPVDRKNKQPGTLREVVNTRLIEALYLAKYNVVDIDTYGEPWELWWTLFNQIITRTVVFLTRGSAKLGNNSQFVLERMGIPANWRDGELRDWLVPNVAELGDMAEQFFIVPESRTCKIERAFKAQSENATYYGLLCKPTGEGPKRQIDL